MRGGFLAWYLGHEIGHAVLHSSYVRESGRNVHFDDPDYDHRELEADSYVARALTEPSALTSNFWNSIGEFIENEYRNVYKELQPLGRVREVNPHADFFPLRYEMTIEYSQYSMPLLLRASRIIDVLTQQSPGLDSTGYYQAVRQNIKVKQSRTGMLAPIVIALAVLILVVGVGLFLSAERRRGQQ